MSPRPVLAALAAVLLGAGALWVALGSSSGNDGKGTRGSRADVWIALRPALLARTEVAAARVGRFVYVVGGFVRGPDPTTAAVERYDIERDRWRRVKSMPIGLNHPAATAYRGDIYVLGGYSGRGLNDEVSSFFRYDPSTNRWSRLPRAPTKRAALAVGVIGRKLYAAGGANSAQGALKRLEIFDFKRRRWSRGPDMRTAREHLAGVVADGMFYVLAGRAAGRGNFSVAERYVPSKRRWEQLPDMNKPRGGIAAAAVGKRVVVFGGEEAAGTIRDVELYDPRLNRWAPLPDMRTPRHGLGGVSRGRRVYAIEGGPTPGFDFSNAIEALDIVPARIAGENGTGDAR
jgi:N-acetylneuraminic acid mutarotase